MSYSNFSTFFNGFIKFYEKAEPNIAARSRDVHSVYVGGVGRHLAI